jgi:hypothetical protein
MKPPITDKQAALLLFCAEFYAANDQLPPYHAMSERFGWASDNSGLEAMLALRWKGYVERNALGKWKFTDLGRAFITERAHGARAHPTNGTAELTNGSVVLYSHVQTNSAIGGNAVDRQGAVWHS